MSATDQEIEKAAEDHAFQKGNAHTIRTEPAWHYSIIDFKAGVAWERKKSDKLIEALNTAIDYLEPRLASKAGSRGLTIVLPSLKKTLEEYSK